MLPPMFSSSRKADLVWQASERLERRGRRVAAPPNSGKPFGYEDGEQYPAALRPGTVTDTNHQGSQRPIRTKHSVRNFDGFTRPGPRPRRKLASGRVRIMMKRVAGRFARSAVGQAMARNPQRHPFFDTDRNLNREGLVLRRLTGAVAFPTHFFDDRTTAATVAAGGDSLVQDVSLGLPFHMLSRAFAVFATLGCGAPAWPRAFARGTALRT